MFDVLFSVKVEVTSNEVVKIVGSLPELGAWNPHLASSLALKKGLWQGPTIKISLQKNIEFKVIKVTEDGHVQWQQLPYNSNRKFRPRTNSKLHLVWSSAEGKISALTRDSIKVHDLTTAIPIQSSTRKKCDKTAKKSNEKFDPYRSAYKDEDSDSQQQQQFEIVKRKMSDQIAINSLDLQQIYYNSCQIQINWDLLNKLKFYVISNQNEINNPFLLYVQQQIKQLPSSYMVKWITSDCLLCDDKQRSNHRKSTKRGSMFEIKQQQLHMESLYSKKSYFMLLQIETALKLKGKIGHVPVCLFLPSNKYNEVIDLLPDLSHIQLICFDQPETNQAYLKFIKENQGFALEGSNQEIFPLSVDNPSINEMIEALKELKYRDKMAINTLGSLTQRDALRLIENQNTITVVDAHLAQNYPEFIQKIIQNLHHYSLVVIVSQLGPSQDILTFRQHKNVVFVYDNFEKIILEGKQYHPLRNCKEMIEILKIKLKFYQENHNGDISQNNGILIYQLPEGKRDLALRIQRQLKHIANRYSFIKISLKGLILKVSWNLALQARILRTICEIKYTNFGELGNFNILSDRMKLRQLKDALRLLIQHRSRLFLAKQNTKVRYFSYGDGQAATCHILPESNTSQSEPNID